MYRTFSISQLFTIVCEYQAATGRDFLCYLSSVPAGKALASYDQAEKALEPEKTVAAFDQILRVAEEVVAKTEAEDRLAQGEATEEAFSNDNSESRFVR